MKKLKNVISIGMIILCSTWFFTSCIPHVPNPGGGNNSNISKKVKKAIRIAEDNVNGRQSDYADSLTNYYLTYNDNGTLDSFNYKVNIVSSQLTQIFTKCNYESGKVTLTKSSPDFPDYSENTELYYDANTKWITKIKNTNGDIFNYFYNTNGQITEIKDGIQVRFNNFVYDSLNNITSFNEKNGIIIAGDRIYNISYGTKDIPYDKVLFPFLNPNNYIGFNGLNIADYLNLSYGVKSTKIVTGYSSSDVIFSGSDEFTYEFDNQNRITKLSSNFIYNKPCLYYY